MKPEALAAVAAKFRASLPGKASEIEAALRSRPTLLALMHKLGGGAGFYDEKDIAALAQDLERRLDPARTDDPDNAVLERDIIRLVAMLRDRARDT